MAFFLAICLITTVYCEMNNLPIDGSLNRGPTYESVTDAGTNWTVDALTDGGVLNQFNSAAWDAVVLDDRSTSYEVEYTIEADSNVHRLGQEIYFVS